MWDKMFDCFLSSCRDPLAIGSGERWMYDPTYIYIVTTGNSTIRSIPSIRWNNNKKGGIDSLDSASDKMMKSVANMFSALSKGGHVVEKSAPKASDFIIKNLTMDDLYKSITLHKLHLEFLKENHLCSDVKRDAIIKRIEIFSILFQKGLKMMWVWVRLGVVMDL